MSTTRGTVERKVVSLSSAAALTLVASIVVLIVARRMFVAAHQPLSWGAAATVAAVLLDPIVDRLALRIRRVPAVLLTFVAIGTVAVGTVYLVFDQVQTAIDRLQEVAPAAAERIEERDDRLGEIAVDFGLEDRITSFTETLAGRVTGGDDVLRSTAGTAPTYLVSAILTVFLMTYGPRMAAAALQQVPDEQRRERIAGLVGPAVGRARLAVISTAATGVVVGLIVSGLATLLDLPAPTALGFTAGLIALLPHLGVVTGSIPLLLVTVGFRSVAAAAVLAVVVVGLQVLDSLVVRRWITRHSVDIGLLVPWVVALLGYAVYGIGGAAYGLCFAVLGIAILDQLVLADGHPGTHKQRPASAPKKKAPAKKKAAAKRS